jgi:hypothetical protein
VDGALVSRGSDAILRDPSLGRRGRQRHGLFRLEAAGGKVAAGSV